MKNRKINAMATQMVANKNNEIQEKLCSAALQPAAELLQEYGTPTTGLDREGVAASREKYCERGV